MALPFMVSVFVAHLFVTETFRVDKPHMCIGVSVIINFRRSFAFQSNRRRHRVINTTIFSIKNRIRPVSVPMCGENFRMRVQLLTLNDATRYSFCIRLVSRASRHDSLSFRARTEWHLNIRSVRLSEHPTSTFRAKHASRGAVDTCHCVSTLGCLVRRNAFLRVTRRSDGECNEHAEREREKEKKKR